MNKLKNRIAAAGIALAAFVGVAVVASPTAAPAQAGDCSAPFVCGVVEVTGGNTVWLVHSWPYTNIGGYFRPGTKSTDAGWKDTDGFVTRPGWCTNLWNLTNWGNWQFITTYGQGDVKITDYYLPYRMETWDC